MTQTKPAPRIAITYCSLCNWMLRSAWLGQELLSTFGQDLGEVALIPRTGGIFQIHYDGELIWDRKVDGGFPDSKVLKQRVRDVILAACSANARVLTTPGPSLTLEGIENGQLIFQAIAYVPGPRLASSVKSELLFTILADLREAGLPLSTTPSVVIASPPPPAGAGLA